VSKGNLFRTNRFKLCLTLSTLPLIIFVKVKSCNKRLIVMEYQLPCKETDTVRNLLLKCQKTQADWNKTLLVVSCGTV